MPTVNCTEAGAAQMHLGSWETDEGSHDKFLAPDILTDRANDSKAPNPFWVVRNMGIVCTTIHSIPR